MNPILQVKLRFANERNAARPNGRTLRATAVTTAEKMDQLIENLKVILRFYHDTNKYIRGVLVDVNYNDIIAKSKRIQEVLRPQRKTTNDVVVGARFSDAPEGEEKHIITYYVDAETVRRTIYELEIARKFIAETLDGKATANNFNELKDAATYRGYGLSKSKIRELIIDCSVIDSFAVPHVSGLPGNETFLVTFYKTELSIDTLMERLGIDRIRYQYTSYGSDTLSVTKDLYDIFADQVPFLISMVSTDLSKIALQEIKDERPLAQISIPSPGNEPVVGVIDTLFDENVYFSEWVENIDYLDQIERLTSKDSDCQREHGTEVTSIIVDGPRLNPWLDDGCGRFKVRHFGVCVDRISTARLVRKIKEIVTQNPDIHVWNLSLGTEDEVSRNFISYDGSVLDELQSQKNIIFVISGTNDNRDIRFKTQKVGSPADSLNAVVVNSVRRDGHPASYSRKGNILSFFNKPDFSYYGGDYDERINAYSPTYGIEEVYGTSFAAPWISRKLCYLIDVMGIPREVAKALIIDSAAGWEYKRTTYKHKDVVGYGIVPIDIQKVLSTDSEEIKFFVYGVSESYKTANYGIPVPKDSDNKYPFVARATLCYFPECSRAQGVDYTSRELSLSFGRINSKGKIDDINDNVQDDDTTPVDERRSRSEFRKWENTKFISKVLKDNSRPIKSYDDRLWGIAITSKERLSSRTGKQLNFGAVITLKEINGVNRIDDFIKACTLRGWLVNAIDVQYRLDIYNTNQEEIIFE